MPTEIRMLTSVSDVALGSAFFRQVWGGNEDVVPVDIALASGHVGGYFSGAFDGDTLVAAAYGFAGEHSGQSILHSHVTASQERGAGYLLKLHQREWAADAGFEAITWTFDPLVRRNAVFNLEKLGAVTVEYLVNFYGEMHDELNRGEQSDRLFAIWPTRTVHEQVTQGSAPSSSSNLVAAIRVAENGAPIVEANFSEGLSRGQSFTIELPADIEVLRANNSEAAAHWRIAVREVLQPAFASGATIRQMTPDRAALLVEWHTEGAK